MSEPQSRARAAALAWRAGRFLYLLWGGLMLMRLVSVAWPRFPAWVLGRPAVAAWLSGPLGRGLLFGVGLAMALAALREVWELVGIALPGTSGASSAQRPREGGR